MNKLISCNLKNDTWLTTDQACKLLDVTPKTLKERCRKGLYTHRIIQDGKKYLYLIQAKSLPINIKEELNIDDENNYEIYSDAPEWSKIQADKYIRIIKSSKHLKGIELKEFINDWNSKNPENTTSYWSVLRMRKRYQAYGISGLLAKYGKNYQKTKIPAEYLDYFKNLYLVEGAPSLLSCWENTLGYAMRTSNIKRNEFPSYTTFIRKLKQDIPESAIYLARYGESAYNVRYGNYLNRDYSNITCGKVWVSDHAQIDVAVFAPDGNVVFPWVTAWRDYKSGKWLGWILQCGSPNSDRIFQAFYYAVQEYGLPEDVIIDNGKDYRCYDFAGGRPQRADNVHVENNKNKTTSMLDLLNVQVHFALPYNAQTKPIERDFLKIKHMLSKNCEGYRGGNVLERPEKLIQEIKDHKIMDFEEFKTVFDDFIVNIFNRKGSAGKNHKGLCPDELFYSEYKQRIAPSADALKLFCMRTSKTYTISRNGIIDRQLDITYWADWLVSKTKVKVYLRRDPNNYKVAWVFKADNNEFLGKVVAVNAVAALHANEVSKAEFQEAMAIKKRSLKITKEYLKEVQSIPFSEKCENYKSAYKKDIDETKPKITKLANTIMDQVIRQNKEMEANGKYDMSMFLNDDTPKKKFYYYETEKELDEDDDLMEVAYGY